MATDEGLKLVHASEPEGLSSLSAGSDIAVRMRAELERLRTQAREQGYDLPFSRALMTAMRTVLNAEPPEVRDFWAIAFTEQHAAWEAAYEGAPSPLSRFTLEMLVGLDLGGLPAAEPIAA